MKLEPMKPEKEPMKKVQEHKLMRPQQEQVPAKPDQELMKPVQEPMVEAGIGTVGASTITGNPNSDFYFPDVANKTQTAEKEQQEQTSYRPARRERKTTIQRGRSWQDSEKNQENGEHESQTEHNKAELQNKSERQDKRDGTHSVLMTCFFSFLIQLPHYPLFGKLSGYKMNLNKTEVLPINNKACALDFTSLPPKLSTTIFLFVHLSRDLLEKLITLLNQTEQMLTQWSPMSMSFVGRTNSVKVIILSKFLYQFLSLDPFFNILTWLPLHICDRVNNHYWTGLISKKTRSQGPGSPKSSRILTPTNQSKTQWLNIH